MTTEELFKMIKWARRNGAQHIKVPGLEMDFGDAAPVDDPEPQTPTPMPEQQSQQPQDTPRPLPPNLTGFYKDGKLARSADNSRSDQPPALKSQEDDPDIYARNSDMWANYQPLPRR